MPCKDIKFSSKIKPFKVFEWFEMSGKKSHCAFIEFAFIIRFKYDIHEQNMYYGFNNYVNEKLSYIKYPEWFSYDGISSYKDRIVVCSAIS